MVQRSWLICWQVESGQRIDTTLPTGVTGLLNLGNSVAAVATNSWAAMQGANSASVTWNTPANASAMTSSTILADATTLMASGTPGSPLTDNVGSAGTSYGAAKVLHGINMDIAASQVTAIIGPSGCGKSTFIRCLNRMHEVVPKARIEGAVELDVLARFRLGLELLLQGGGGELGLTFEHVDALGADDMRRSLPRFQGEHFARNLALVRTFTSKAEALGCTPAQLALAWVLAKGADLVPIPGTKRVACVEDDMAAVSVTLSVADVAALGPQ